MDVEEAKKEETPAATAAINRNSGGVQGAGAGDAAGTNAVGVAASVGADNQGAGESSGTSAAPGAATVAAVGEGGVAGGADGAGKTREFTGLAGVERVFDDGVWRVPGNWVS